MNRLAILIASFVVFGLVALNFVLASNLILPHDVVEQRGAGVAWYLVWAMVLLMVGCGIILGIFLLSSSLSRRR